MDRLKKRDGRLTRFLGYTQFIGLEGARIWETNEIMRLRINGGNVAMPVMRAWLVKFGAQFTS
jgi:hypothetical protein